MNEPASIPKRKKDLFARRIWWFVILFILLLGAFSIYHEVLNRKLLSKQNEVRCKGFPITLPELNAWYDRVPDNDNAALIYLEAFETLSPESKDNIRLPLEGSTNLPPPGTPVPQEMMNEIEKYLKLNGRALKFLHEGRTMEKSRYPFESRNYNDLNPFLKVFRRSGKLLFLEAMWFAGRHQEDDAVGSLLALGHLANSLKNEPDGISIILCQTLILMAVEGVERMLGQTSLSEENIKRLEKLFAKCFDGSGGNLVRGIAASQVIFNHQFSLSHDELPWTLDYKGTPSMRSSGHEHNAWFYFYHGLYRLSGIPNLERIRFYDDFLALVEFCSRDHYLIKDSVSQWQLKNRSIPRFFYHSKISRPRLEVQLNGYNEYVAKVRIVQTALAVEKFRNGNLALPASQQDLIPDFLPALPVDPFDGQILHYRVSNKGYTIYSIGQDEIDNHGLPPRSRIGTPPAIQFDLTFTVER